MQNSSINYVDITWNPIVMRCDPVSKGCEKCWHLRMCKRLSGNKLLSENKRAIYSGNNEPCLIGICQENYRFPKGPKVIAVQFMGDLFHTSVSDLYIDFIMSVIANNPDHIFMILTKRAARMHYYFEFLNAYRAWLAKSIFDPEDILNLSPKYEFPLKNLWVGISAEDQETLEQRAGYLAEANVSHKFISLEPLLGAVDLRHIDVAKGGHPRMCQINILTGRQTDMGRPCSGFKPIEQIIVGGETGPSARLLNRDWFINLRDQRSLVPEVKLWLKQWGSGKGQYNNPYELGGRLAYWKDK